MKKTLLVLASCAMSMSSFAQWTAPVPSKTLELSTDEAVEGQYLYNKDAGAFFSGGNDWNTRASVSTVAEAVRFVVADGDNYNFMCYPTVSNKNAWLYVSCNASDAMWVDAPNADANNDYPGTDTWHITKIDNGAYKISNGNYPGATFGVAEYYQGVRGNTRCYINDVDLVYEVNEEAMPCISGKFYDEWVFIDAEEVEALKPKVEAYLAAVSLAGAIDAVKAQDANYDLSVINKVYNNTSSTVEELNDAKAIANAVVEFAKALDKARADYPNLDYSAPIAVYKNVNSTKEDLDAAKGQIQEVINKYLSENATFDNPVDYKDKIGDGSDVGPWTREFTGDGQIGTWHTNTWSTEANGGADGTDMLTPFCEDWVANGTLLSDQKIFQVLNGAAPGLYKFTANIRLYNEAGNVDNLTGCTMYFGDNRVTLDEQVAMYKSGNKCVLWNPNKFSIIAIVEEGGDIEFGFDIKDPQFNWMAFKETSLKYYGNDNVQENALKLAKEGYEFEKYEGDEAQDELITAYNNAVDAFDNASSKDEIDSAINDITSAKKELEDNINAYRKLLSQIEKWDSDVAENQGVTGDDWAIFSDYIQLGEEYDGYPTPAPLDIVNGDRSLSTAEIDAYITAIDELYRQAIAKGLIPGTDCSNMLANAKFTDPNGAGWIKGGNCNNYANPGGFIPTAAAPNAGFPVAESWHSTFDIYQVVENVPDGIYSLSLNGFCRLDDGVDSEVPAYIYMNDFATRLMNIEEGKISVDEAQDGYNCYRTTANDGPWASNPIFTGAQAKSPANNADTEVDGYLWPNGMEGASVAFSAGRYEAKVYGLVDGGTMRLGIRNLTSTHVWALWGNFTLTYEGKSLEALNDVLPKYIDDAEDYLEEHENSMTTPARDNLDKVLGEAAKAKSSADVDDMYDALIALNAAKAEAEENVQAVKDLDKAAETLEDAYNSYGSSAKKDAVDAYKKAAAKYADYEGYTTAQVKELIDEMNAAANALKIPDTDNASDENPVNVTGLIANADFEENAAQQQANGWTLEKGANGNYQVQTGYDGGVSMEFWSNSNGSDTQFNFYQKIVGLPAGTYELTADASNSYNDVDAGPGEGRAYIYAAAVNGEDIAKALLSEPIYQQTEGCRDAYSNYSVIIKIEEGQGLLIGAKNIGELGARWVMIDNFQLNYFGPASSKTESEADPTAIESVAPATTAAAIYSVSGARVNALKKGINIVKMSDGSVKKVLVK